MNALVFVNCFNYMNFRFVLFNAVCHCPIKAIWWWRRWWWWCLFGTHLLRNSWTDLAEILHRGGLSVPDNASRILWRSPQGFRQGSRKCTTGETLRRTCTDQFVWFLTHFRNVLFRTHLSLYFHKLCKIKCLLKVVTSKAGIVFNMSVCLRVCRQQKNVAVETCLVAWTTVKA